MDYRFARAFLATAESKSFSKAAKELKVAQSAISRQIKLLEESLGFQLFFRSNKHVSLTQRGELLFTRLRDFDKWAAHEYNSAPTEIRISALDGIMNSYVIPRISRVKISAPLKLTMMTLNHNEMEAAILRGEIDIALTYLPIKAEGYACRRLFEETMHLISSKPVKDSELSNDTWIHMGKAHFLKKLCGKNAKNEVIVNSLTSIVSLVTSGLGIAVVPEHSISSMKGIHHRPINESSKIYLIARDFIIKPNEFKEILAMLENRPRSRS